jgi:hypothetical protein
MPDNVGYTPGIGATVAAEEILGILFQRIKLTLGADGVNDGDVSSSNPMPTQAQKTDELLSTIQMLMGILVGMCESLQVVDAAQRQRIAIDAIAAGLTLATVTTVNTVNNVGTITTLSNSTAMAGMDREMYINIADQTYALCIRQHLKFE